MSTTSVAKKTKSRTTIDKGAARAERILAIDVGGTGLKAAIISEEGEMKSDRLRVATPHPATPEVLVDTLIKLVEPLVAEPPTHISIGFPGVVRNNVVLTAPNLGNEYWNGIPLADLISQRVGGVPVRMINDAEMQGLAAIEGRGLEFVLTLGTGAGTALFRDGELMPHLELAHHPVSKKGDAYDQYIGAAAREKAGNKRWNKRVQKVIGILSSLVNYDKLWIGGGNAANLKFELPPNVAVVSNAAGIEGGAKLWHPRSVRETRQLPHFNAQHADKEKGAQA
ncbi:ROK family protein [Caballeronia sp. LP006]|uniref:ROK family protein n=1 Tax=unclassified Caballeronia TaxID=2646786 RepID=UPI00202931CE|nr:MULTISPECIES: ROK family protein [unclassified Caballeronia]MDR5775772.1 ROK family protein [Caballeronia sp. LZ002]MDR5802081.1 ROK family protein [Caballeronia sp. LZ001]MDR5828487.1 ROK family protein [Caballeronia sp. LP006]MDR5851210.1 ROK family protein [Caballeronia sp. LZ003]